MAAAAAKPKTPKKKYYAVRNGRQTGLLETWAACRASIQGYPNAIYKSFFTREEAEAYLSAGDATPKLDGATALTAYVDGSYMSGKRRIGFAAVLLKNGETLQPISGALTDPSLLPFRNVAGELAAAMRAMQYAVQHGEPELIIWHDYEGIAAWCTGAWAANTAVSQAYRDYYLSVKDRLTVEFRKVRGHSGNLFNDMADELAKAAALGER